MARSGVESPAVHRLRPILTLQGRDSKVMVPFCLPHLGAHCREGQVPLAMGQLRADEKARALTTCGAFTHSSMSPFPQALIS